MLVGKLIFSIHLIAKKYQHALFGSRNIPRPLQGNARGIDGCRRMNRMAVQVFTTAGMPGRAGKGRAGDMPGSGMRKGVAGII
ncbi:MULTISPECIES: hypothetical protein [Aquitalea]|uniref:hypothetical protein n=1 Tax=Aquitalea TaxID=407217 RepID=UPI000F594036|nr:MULTISPECIES: hypothetical protein [Aquitalea]